jgi:hypothetical protein
MIGDRENALINQGDGDGAAIPLRFISGNTSEFGVIRSFSRGKKWRAGLDGNVPTVPSVRGSSGWI